jgi:hypothetical protein
MRRSRKARAVPEYAALWQDQLEGLEEVVSVTYSSSQLNNDLAKVVSMCLTASVC